jgi:hypothetical protein
MRFAIDRSLPRTHTNNQQYSFLPQLQLESVREESSDTTQPSSRKSLAVSPSPRRKTERKLSSPTPSPPFSVRASTTVLRARLRCWARRIPGAQFPLARFGEHKK